MVDRESIEQLRETPENADVVEELVRVGEELSGVGFDRVVAILTNAALALVAERGLSDQLAAALEVFAEECPKWVTEQDRAALALYHQTRGDADA